MASPIPTRVTTTRPPRLYRSPRPPRTPCDDLNCSGSCGTPRVGTSNTQIGDVLSVCMSVYTPFKSLFGIRTDSQSFYSGSGTKGARPCIILSMPNKKNYTILIMASFCKTDEEHVPAAFKDFLIPIPTSHWRVSDGVEHVHTTPQWESAPQYLVMIPVTCPVKELKGRWQSYKVDATSKQRFSFYLDDLALASLIGIVRKKYAQWDSKGKHELTREEYLARLEKVKETHAETLRSSTNTSQINIPNRPSGCKRTIASRVPSLIEVPEEEGPDGWKTVPEKRRRKDKPPSRSTPSNRSRCSTLH